MPLRICLFLASLTLLSCTEASTHAGQPLSAKQVILNIPNENPYPTIADIPVPEGFEREQVDNHGFAAWLRKVPLKRSKTVHLYDGSEKRNQQAQFAVLNISVGQQDLQQCADAVMRLRAEYLFAENQFNQIDFTDNESNHYPFTAPYTRDHFMSYLNRVFGMCGSASLSKQLKSKQDIRAIIPGDVWIHGGFPGHAVMVMDRAVSKDGRIIYLIAQGYMPAQDIHLLNNPSDAQLSPWYQVTDDNEIVTPEYLFYKDQLKRW